MCRSAIVFSCLQVVDTDERIAAIHYHSERFDWKAEGVFKYLQASAPPAVG